MSARGVIFLNALIGKPPCSLAYFAYFLDEDMKEEMERDYIVRMPLL